MLFYGSQIDSIFDVQNNARESDHVVIKIFDVRNRTNIDQYLNEVDAMLKIKESGKKGFSDIIDYGKTNPSNSIGFFKNGEKFIVMKKLG